MTEIKWFKLDSHTFDSAEMRYLGKVDASGALYQLIWVKLLCEAAKRDDGGRIYVYKERAISVRDIAILIDMNESCVGDAVSLFAALGMVKYDEESGLVIKNFSDYVGEGYGSAEYELYRDDEKAQEATSDVSDEEIKRERNREAQRRWRERNKQRGVNKKACGSVTEHNNTVIQRNAERNNTVIQRNTEHNSTVIQRNTEHNESNADSVISALKNIFIEEKRIEESRIEDKREEEIRKEEKNENNTLSFTLPLSDACERSSLPLGNGCETETVRTLPQSSTVAAHSRGQPSVSHNAQIRGSGTQCETLEKNRGYAMESADAWAQKKPPQNKSRGGMVRTITAQEANEAFMLALERSTSGA